MQNHMQSSFFLGKRETHSQGSLIKSNRSKLVMGETSRVLIIGGTGQLGRLLVKASISLGHQTLLLYREENALDKSKTQILVELKMHGAQLCEGSLDDMDEMVAILKKVEVVVCSLSGISLLQQLKLVDAIRKAGNLKRFLPTEFGMEADRMRHAIEPANMVFDHKREVRRAVEKAGVPYTYVVANCFAGHFLAGLAQLHTFLPPTDHVFIYGNGDKKCIWVDEKDVAMYSLLSISDPRTKNKIVHIRPRANILSQMEVVRIWENMISKKMGMTFLREEEWLQKFEGIEFHMQIDAALIYHIFYCGDLLFDLDEDGHLNTEDLYPDYKYVTVQEYLKRFI